MLSVVGYRQWVLSFTGPMAVRLGYDQPLLAEVAGALARAGCTTWRWDNPRINLIRIPLHASSDEAFKNGQPDFSNNQKYINAVKAAKQVNPNLKVFASLATVCGLPGPACYEFDSSLKTAPEGPIDPVAYGQFVAQYLNYMRSQSVPINYLGVDNEGAGAGDSWFGSNNEGQISGARYETIINTVDTNYAFTMPLTLFNDAKMPDVRVMCGLTDSQWTKVNIATTHYEADKRERTTGPDEAHRLPVPERLKELGDCAAAKQKRTWNTEFHYTEFKDDNDEARGDYFDAVMALLAVFDQMDAGLTGIVWWGYHGDSASNEKKQIQTKLVNSLKSATAGIGGQPFLTTDLDGVDPSSKDTTKFTSRAIKLGQDVKIWVVNATDVTRDAMPIKIYRGTDDSTSLVTVPAGQFSLERWSKKPAGNDLYTPSTAGQASVTNGVLSVRFPAHSITLVTLNDVL